MILIYLKDGKIIDIKSECQCRIEPVFSFDLSDPCAEPEIVLVENMTKAEKMLCIEGRK